MTKNEIIAKLNEVYPDGYLEWYWDFKKGKMKKNLRGGDDLAQFIVTEVATVWGDGEADVENLKRTTEVLERAVGELQLVLAQVKKCGKSTRARKRRSGAR